MTKIHQDRGSCTKNSSKKKNLRSDASSRFGGNTSASTSANGTLQNVRCGSKRTIADFLEFGGRDEVDVKVV